MRWFPLATGLALALAACARLDGLSGGTDVDAGAGTDAGADAGAGTDAGAGADAAADAAADAEAALVYRGQASGFGNATGFSLLEPTEAKAGDALWIIVVSKPGPLLSIPSTLAIVDDIDDTCSPTRVVILSGTASGNPSKSYEFALADTYQIGSLALAFGGVEAAPRQHAVAFVGPNVPWQAPPLEALNVDVPGTALLSFVRVQAGSIAAPSGASKVVELPGMSFFAVPTPIARKIQLPTTTAGPCGIASTAFFKYL